jgi:two-component system, chemotaxis family, protein-glutamate methylesterase/glutaminase
MASDLPGNRDIVVIGGSAGALDPLIEVVGQFPAGLPAAVLVTTHRPSESAFLLPEILARRAHAQVREAVDHDPIEMGVIYVASPDRHLLVKAGEIRSVRGPRENGFRPAIDPLFRTAAAAYGNRVIGVLLSGMLDDGCIGLWQIQQRGGLTVVQNPELASQPSMPQCAIDRVDVDHILSPGDIGRLLVQATGAEFRNAKPAPSDELDVVEGTMDALRMADYSAPSPFVCPDCGGALWEIQEGPHLRYRCHVGHGLTADALNAMQTRETERLLWSAVRVIEEQGALQRRLAEKWRGQANASLSQRFLEKAQTHEKSADVLRSLVTSASHIVEQPTPRGAAVEEYNGGG